MLNPSAATKLSAALYAALTLAILTPSSLSAKTTAQPKTTDITASVVGQSPLAIDELRIVEIGGIVVIRGRADSAAKAEAANVAVKQMGYERVANLVQIVETPDDDAIERRAERALAAQRSLDGCDFQLDSQGGVLRVAGRVQYELQKDMASQILRSVEGVKLVKNDLQR